MVLILSLVTEEMMAIIANSISWSFRNSMLVTMRPSPKMGRITKKHPSTRKISSSKYPIETRI